MELTIRLNLVQNVIMHESCIRLHVICFIPQLRSVFPGSIRKLRKVTVELDTSRQAGSSNTSNTSTTTTTTVCWYY